MTKKTYTREELMAARRELGCLRDRFVMINPHAPGAEGTKRELRVSIADATKKVERIEQWFRRNHGWSN